MIDETTIRHYLRLLRKDLVALIGATPPPANMFCLTLSGNAESVGGASKIGGAIAPYDLTILGVSCYVDEEREDTDVDLRVGGSSVLSAVMEPDAVGSVVTGTVASSSVAAGAEIQLYADTGADMHVTMVVWLEVA